MDFENVFDGYEIRFVDLEYELSSYDKGSSGCSIYISLLNASGKTIKVKHITSYIINSSSEQRERDYYLTGYNFEEKSIRPSAKRTMCEIFFQDTAGKIKPGWCYGVEFEDFTNGRNYNLLYKLCIEGPEQEWELISCDISEIEKKKSPKMLARQLQGSIERIEAFEEQLNIRLENISIKISDSYNYLELFCDVFSTAGNSLSKDIDLAATFYDAENTILATEEKYIGCENFMGFESCAITVYINAEEIDHIRFYPKKA